MYLAYSRHSVSVSCCHYYCWYIILIVVLLLRGQGHLGSAEKQVPSSARYPALLGPRARTPHSLVLSLLRFAKLSEPLSNPVASSLPKSVPNFQNSFLNSGKEMRVQASLWEERKARRPLSAPLPQSQRCTGSHRQRLLGSWLRTQAVCWGVVPRSVPTATPRCCGRGRRTSGVWWASATCGAMT